MTTAAWEISNNSAIVQILAMEAEVKVEAGHHLFEDVEAIVAAAAAAEEVIGKIVEGAVDSEDAVDTEAGAGTSQVTCRSME